MSVGHYLTGLGFLVGTLSGTGIAAWLTVRRRLSHLSGAPLLTAFGLVFILALAAAHIVPGALGLLSRVSVLVCAVLLGLMATRLRPGTPAGRDVPREEHDSPLGLGLAAVAVGLVVAATAAAFGELAHVAPEHVDAQTFSLPEVADWIRSRSLWGVGTYLPLFQVRTYPNNGDLMFLAAMLPWRSDAFIRLVPLPLLGLTGVGVYAIGRELRACRSVAVLVACLLVATRIVAYPAVDQLKPDVFMYATFAGGVLFLLRHVRTGARSDLVLGGVGLGLALGARWYGLSAAFVVVLVWAAGLLLARRGPGAIGRQALLLGASVLAAGGFWLVRNAALTGNPLYPVKLSVFGVTVLDAPRDVITERIGLTLVDRLGQWSAWKDLIVPDYKAALGLPGLLLLVGVGIAVVLAARAAIRSPGRVPWRVVGLVIVTAGLAVSYALTPGSAQGPPRAPLPGLVGGNARWLVPAMVTGAGLTAWSVSALGRVRPLAQALLFAGVLAGLADSFDVSPGKGVMWGLACALVAATAALAVRSAGNARRRAGAFALAALLVVAAVVAGDHLQRRYLRERYVGRTAALSWVLAHAPEGRRIGIAGDWQPGFVPLYGLFGPGFGNSVSYVGPVRQGQISRYHRAEGFQRGLARGGFDLLVVGFEREPDLVAFRARPPYRDPPPARWAREAGWREVVRDSAYVLLARPTR